MEIREDIRNMLCIAHDVSNFEDMRYFADKLGPYAKTSKIGFELFTSPFAFQAIDYILKQERNVFVDLKILDVLETTRKAVRNLAACGVHMCTIHIGDPQGKERLRIALENKGDMKILAVTVLTSIPRSKDIGLPVPTQVLYRAMTALGEGADGIICSAEDLARLYRADVDFSKMLKVTPGIRPAGSPNDDQKSIMTPAEATRISLEDSGMHMMVIGRPLTNERYNNNDPEGAAQRIHAEIAEALSYLPHTPL